MKDSESFMYHIEKGMKTTTCNFAIGRIDYDLPESRLVISNS